MQNDKADEEINILTLSKNNKKNDKEYCILQSLFVFTHNRLKIYFKFDNNQNITLKQDDKSVILANFLVYLFKII